MTLFRRNEGYDRARILRAADRASARNQTRRAVRLYRRVLSVEASNPELHARVAPLLARTRQTFDAWVSYRQAARAFQREGRVDRAIDTYRDAARTLPREMGVPLALCKVLRKSGKDRDALAALLEGRCRLTRRSERAHAVHLLRCARELQPWNPEIVLDLARLLSRADQSREAESLLEALSQRCTGSGLRRVRAAQWRLSPTLRNTWRWLRVQPEPQRRRPSSPDAALPALRRETTQRRNRTQVVRRKQAASVRRAKPARRPAPRPVQREKPRNGYRISPADLARAPRVTVVRGGIS